MWKARACTVLVCIACAQPASAQGRRADYERANRLENIMGNYVFRTSVSPQFVGSRGLFWYRVATGYATYEFVLVDPYARTRVPLFDAKRLAAALDQALCVDKRFSFDALPVERLVVDADAHFATFSCRDRRWRWDRVGQSLEPAPPSPPVDGIPVWTAFTDRSSGGRMTIVFENSNAGAVDLYGVTLDGTRLAFGTIAPGETREQPTREGHVWIAVDAKRRELAAFIANVEHERVRIPPEPIDQVADDSAYWRGVKRFAPDSPDGVSHVRFDQGVLFRSDRVAGESRLEHSRRPGFASAVEWAPDSCRLVAYDQTEADERRVTVVESSPSDQVQPRLHSFEYDKPGDRQCLRIPTLVDMRGDELREITIDPPDAFANPASIGDVRWSRDSSRFTTLYAERGYTAQRLLAVDANTGSVTTLVENASPTFVDAVFKTFVHWVDDGDDEVIWMSERSGWNHLELIDAARGGIKNAITSGEFVVKRVVHVDDAARRLWFIACGLAPGENPYHEHLCSVQFDGSGFMRLTKSDTTHEVTFTPDHRYFIDVASRVDLPPVTQLRRADDGTLVVELETADCSHLDAAGWRAPERFVAKGRDGKTDIWGILVRPTNFDPARSYPVVEHIYAGPQDAYVPKAFSPSSENHWLAELGFVVVQIDGMGTNWRSKAFHDVCWRNLQDAGIPDHIAWLEAAAAKYPELDLKRVGIYGASSGGQNALAALLNRGDFYSVGIADCGCHDNRMGPLWCYEAWMGYPVGPWYAENSNVTNAWKLRGKLLLMVGELDENVDPASTMQVVNALIKADKDFDLLVMPGVGHGTTNTPYGWRRQADFLVRNLLGVEPRTDR